jgi:hypothetical protein
VAGPVYAHCGVKRHLSVPKLLRTLGERSAEQQSEAPRGPAAFSSLAPAITAEVTKACSVLVAKAFPPKEPGNPAAGNATGTPEDHRRYFEKCVANAGHMDDDADQASQKAVK